ncbi:uncharacterized protein TNCV_2725851 [Trichonephila clavipes]|nr:uncharacterized protein TNCV_2725851 [Trichonephila clavipes]
MILMYPVTTSYRNEFHSFRTILFQDNTRLSLGARAAGVHYRLFSVWTLGPVRLGKQLSGNSTVDEIASEAADCRLTYTMANCPQRRKRADLKCFPEFLYFAACEKYPRSACLPFFPEKVEEDISSVSTCNVKEKGEARELKENRETREFEERKLIRAFELERMKVANSTDTISVSSTDLEGQGVNRRAGEKRKVAEDRWVSQLIPLLPMEIAEIVAKEPLEKSDDYPHIKNLLLARFQLTPIALRDRFESHQRRPGAMWADLVFELRSYLDNWLAGMKVGDFAALKELLVT